MGHSFDPVHPDPAKLHRLFHSIDKHAGEIPIETNHISRIAYAPVCKEQVT